MQERRSDRIPSTARKRRSAKTCGEWKGEWWVLLCCIIACGIILMGCHWSHEPITSPCNIPGKQVAISEIKTFSSYWPRKTPKHVSRTVEEVQFFCPTKNSYLAQTFCSRHHVALNVQDGGYRAGSREEREERASRREFAVSDSQIPNRSHECETKPESGPSLTEELIIPMSKLKQNRFPTVSLNEDRRRRALEKSARKVLMSALGNADKGKERSLRNKPKVKAPKSKGDEPDNILEKESTTERGKSDKDEGSARPTGKLSKPTNQNPEDSADESPKQKSHQTDDSADTDPHSQAALIHALALA